MEKFGSPECVVEFHGGHDRPRLFALHEPGRLWYFDLCMPHKTPGDHWSAPEIFRRLENEPGAIVVQSLAGAKQFRNKTNVTPSEFKADFCASLGWTAAQSLQPSITAKYFRSKISTSERGLEWDPDWPPAIPTLLNSTDSTEQSYEICEDAIVFALSSHNNIRDLVKFYDDEGRLSSLYIAPFKDRPNAYITFELEDERWFANFDEDDMATQIGAICERHNVELLIHNELLSEHRPHLSGLAP